MRALVVDGYGELSSIHEAELEAPTAGPGEVLVRVRGAALNPADYKVVSGKDGGRFLHSSRAPIQLGFDFSGIVEGLGAGADLAVGDAVFGHLPYARKSTQGSLAEYVVVPAGSVAVKPAGIGFGEAATLATTGCTALQALRDKANLSAGQRVVINGASGGVGTLAVQMAKALGAEVWALCSAPKMADVRALGADHVIDYRQTDVSALEGTYHAIFDAAASSSYGATARLLEPDGAYVTTLPSGAFVWGVMRAAFSSKRCAVIVVQSKRDDLAQMARWVDEGSLYPQVDRVCRLADVPAALAALKAGEVRGKIAVDLDASAGR